MKPTPLTTLTPAQAAAFVERGFVVVPGCVDPAAAREWVAGGWERLKASPKDPRTWKDGIVHLPAARSVVIRDFSPKGWGAICDALGGEDRVLEPAKNGWSDTFIVNFPVRDGAEPEREYTSLWHLDGNDSSKRLVTLRSADLALISMVAWTRMGRGSGGTEVSVPSLPRVAKLLRENPAGITTSELCLKVKPTSTGVETIEAEAGDLVLMNPYLMHRSAPNEEKGHARFLTTQMHALREAPRLDRGDGSATSPFEASLLRALKD